jgi:hypothetical protein
MASSKLSVAELDFDAIKSSLKNYLKSQSEFSDYDFEGAGINILLDILAYNTHYNSFYLNMVANEMFMDSASLRQSVVSHAKLLGYTPRSTTASEAIVDVTITKGASDPTTALIIPRFTAFNSQSLDGESYIFLATEDAITTNVGSTFTFSNVAIREGTSSSYVFTVSDIDNPKQIFELPDADIDTGTLVVIVQKSADETEQTTYTLATDSTEVSSTSAVYYLEEGGSGKYRIYFGDNIYGKKLTNGNLVSASYVNTKGSASNGLNKFKLATQLLAGSTSNVSTVINSAGGSVRELVDDIKFSAPKSFISNNRAVTKNDYVTLINKKYPYFDAISVWGGEEQSPPVYGKVFIAAKPRLGYEITQTEKAYVINEIIKPFSILTVTPEFVDANYNYILLNVDVIYDPSTTSKTAGQIQSAVRNAISSFSQETLNSFTSTFKLSKLLRYIDDADTSISSSTADIFIQKRFSPLLDSAENYTLTFDTELRRGATSKDKLFSTPSYSQQDATGITRSVFLEETPQSFSGIESVEILTSGTGYTKTPTVTINGDGEGASLSAVIVNGKVKSIKVDSMGTNYTTAVLTIENAAGDTSGGGATSKAIIQGRTGILRSYYFDSVGAKKILDPNAGTIDYVNGIIQLNNFAPTAIQDDLSELRIAAKPNTLEFSSTRSTLITLDTFDPSSIIINIKPVS